MGGKKTLEAMEAVKYILKCFCQQQKSEKVYFEPFCLLNFYIDHVLKITIFGPPRSGNVCPCVRPSELDLRIRSWDFSDFLQEVVAL